MKAFFGRKDLDGKERKGKMKKTFSCLVKEKMRSLIEKERKILLNHCFPSLPKSKEFDRKYS